MWASITSRPQNSGRRASSASAARRNTAARWASGVSFQPLKPLYRRAIAASTSAPVASGTTSARTAAMACSNGSRSAMQAKSTPFELARPLLPVPSFPAFQPYSDTGIANAGLALGNSGEASNTSTSTEWSVNWCTNDELAPFSSSRRTR